MSSSYRDLLRVAGFGALSLLLAAGTIAAQGGSPAPSQDKAAESASEGSTSGEVEGAGSAEGREESLEAPSVDDIDEMLRGEEEIFGTFETYAYDPGERRDPFRSLLVTREAPEMEGPRPEGVPGLLIDEINLIGIIRTPKGYVAQVQAADRQKSFLLHEGEQLFDGEVLSIEENEVVFKQIVRDPTAIKPFRERVKILNPS